MSEMSLEAMKAEVLKQWPGCYPGAYGEGLWWSNARGEMVIVGKSWSDAYAKLAKPPASEVQEGGEERLFPTGGDPKDFCKCNHHEMCHANYVGMNRACNQTGCDCREYEHELEGKLQDEPKISSRPFYELIDELLKNNPDIKAAYNA